MKRDRNNGNTDEENIMQLLSHRVGWIKMSVGRQWAAVTTVRGSSWGRCNYLDERALSISKVSI